jgi:hypothetical protein
LCWFLHQPPPLRGCQAQRHQPIRARRRLRGARTPGKRLSHQKC